MQAKPKLELRDSDFVDSFRLRWKLANHFQHDVLHASFSTFERLVKGLTLQQTMQVTCMLNAHASHYCNHPDNTGLPSITEWTLFHLDDWTRCIQTHQEWRMWEKLIGVCNMFNTLKMDSSNILRFVTSSFLRLSDEELSFVRLHLLLLFRSWKAGYAFMPWFFYDETTLNHIADMTGITDICFFKYAFPFPDKSNINLARENNFSKDLTKATWRQEILKLSNEQRIWACKEKWIARRQHQLEKMKKVRALLVTDASFMCADVFDHILARFLCAFDPLLQNPNNCDHLPVWPQMGDHRVENIRPLFSL